MPAKRTRSRKPDVPELLAPAAAEHGALYRTKAFPFVSEGTVYCFGLREYLEEPSLPRGESAIAALLALESSTVYGVTVGARAHLFYFHPGFGVAHVGALGQTPATGGALLDLGGHQVLGGWWGPEGGGLFRHGTAAEEAQGMEQFRGAKGPVEPLTLPPGEGIAALAGPTPDGVAYGLTLPGGHLVAIDPAAGEVETLARIEQAAPVLLALPDGSLLGAGPEGRLWAYDPAAAQLTALDAWAPCQKGKRYVAGVESLALGRDGLVYGGTSVDGFLFGYDPATGAVTNLGKPNRQSNIRALVAGHDGCLFGVVQEPEGMAHLFRYDPGGRGLTDLGILGAAFPECWQAHALGALSVGPNGEVFVGESDDISHLFVYYPPVPRA